MNAVASSPLWDSMLARLRLASLLSVLCVTPAMFAAGQQSEPPEQHGMDSRILADMTNFIVKEKSPVFSLLISRRGTLVYEMYTHNLTRNHSHYVMSVTKSFTATLVGLAIDKGLLRSVKQNVSEVFPAEAFGSPAEQKRFAALSIRDVLAMSALDALVPPHQQSAEAEQRNRDFHSAPNRAHFALAQKLLPQFGQDFQYQDITPSLAIGMVAAASGKPSWEFARESLFDPMGFANVEWMHADQSGLDLAAYGLRLRPIDMQKFGILYLDKGIFDGKRLLSKEWIDLVYEPVIKSAPNETRPNYGYYFWHPYFYNDATSLMASGWRGQYILTIPEKQLVITMTACFLDGKESEFFIKLINEYILRSVNAAPNKGGFIKLKTALTQALKSTPVNLQAIEPRMVPSVKPFEDAGHYFFPMLKR